MIGFHCPRFLRSLLRFHKPSFHNYFQHLISLIQAVLERIKFYNACTKNFNTNVKSDPKLHTVSLSSTDDQLEVSHTNYRGVEPVYNDRSRGHVVGWNAVTWEGEAKQVLVGSPFESSTDAAKAWDHAKSENTNDDPGCINFPPKAHFFRNPKFPLGSRVVLTRRGKQDGGSVTAFFGKGKYQVSEDGGNFLTVSIPSSIVSVVSRPQAKSSESLSAMYGPGGAMLKLQVLCEQYPAQHGIGSIGLAVGAIRALWRRCRRSGLLLQQSPLHSRNPLGILKPLSHALIALSSLRYTASSSVRCAEDLQHIKSGTRNDGTAKLIGNSEMNSSRGFPTSLKRRDENRKSKVSFRDSSVQLSGSKNRLQGNSNHPMTSYGSENGLSLEQHQVDISDMRTLQNDSPTQGRVSSPISDVVQGIGCCEERNEQVIKDKVSGVSTHGLRLTRNGDSNVPCKETGSASSPETEIQIYEGHSELQDNQKPQILEQTNSGSNVLGWTESPYLRGIDALEQVNGPGEIIANQESCEKSVLEPSDSFITCTDPEIYVASDGKLDEDKDSISKISCTIRDVSDSQEPRQEDGASFMTRESQENLLQSTRDLDNDSSAPRCLANMGKGGVEREAINDNVGNNSDHVFAPYRRNLVRQAAQVSRKLAENPRIEENTGESPKRRKRKNGSDRTTQSIHCDESNKTNMAERVEVNSKGIWWIAIVQQKAQGQVQVKYLDSDGRYSTTCEWVKEDRIRPVQASSPADCGIDVQNLIGVTACDSSEGLGFWTATYTFGIKKVIARSYLSLVLVA